MKHASKFAIQRGWKLLLADMGLPARTPRTRFCQFRSNMPRQSAMNS